MSSDGSEQPIQEPVQDSFQEPVGRTGWDVLHYRGSLILIVLLVILVAVVSIIGFSYFQIDVSSAVDFVRDYWPVFATPFVGWFLCKITFNLLYQPQYRYLVWTDVEHGTFRIIRVPELRFRSMSQLGDSVMFRTTGGVSIYLIKSMTSDSIEFGWVHTIRPEVALVDRDFYMEFRDLTEALLLENLRISTSPNIIALNISRKTLKVKMDDFAKALGLNVTDEVVEDDDFVGPAEYIRKEQQAADDGDSNDSK